MDFDPQDQDIIRLLTKLKDADAKYPEQMLVAQRRSYLKRMTEIGLGIGVDMGIKHAVKNVRTSGMSPVPITVVESALVVAIIAEAGAVAYLYHDKLTDFIQTIVTEPRVQQVVPSPIVTTSLEIQGLPPSPAITPTSSPVVLSASPAIIPVTGTGTQVADDNTASPPVNSTPIPNGNNGNHYGQTPKPERTKESGGNNDKPPKDNGNQSPQDNNDQPPKDKPPKDK